jgi:hypothetical protein
MQAALKYYRDNGWECFIVERRVPRKNITQDAYGFGDILAYNVALKQTALIQTTDASHGANRKNKILQEKRAAGWLRCGNKIFLCLLVTKLLVVKTGKNKGTKRKGYEVRHTEIVI